jgi:hypothetical protein
MIDLRTLFGQPIATEAGVERYDGANGLIIEATADRISITSDSGLRSQDVETAIEQIFPDASRPPAERSLFFSGAYRVEHLKYGATMLSRQCDGENLVCVSLSWPVSAKLSV